MAIRLVKCLSKGLLILSTTLLLVSVLVLLYGVGARYLLNASPIWMDELSRYLIIGSVLLAAGSVYARDEHMRVSIIQKALRGKAAVCLALYHWLLISGLAAYLGFISFHYALSLEKFTTIGLGVSKSVPVFSLAMGFSMLAVIVLLQGPFAHLRKGEGAC